MAEALQRHGYATSMSGKWHLAIDEDQRPNNRGFERSFGLVEGGASHFADQRRVHQMESVTYMENGEPIALAEDFYSTYAYTDKMIEYIGAAGDKPFFAYLAYTAPHDPLQVPDDWLNRYDGVFDDGPDTEVRQRIEKLTALNLVPENTNPPEHLKLPAVLYGRHLPWDERSQAEQDFSARRMEIYAAMVEIVDQQIGRIITELEAAGKLDNTYILFMSDNGASAGTPYSYPANDRSWVNSYFDLSPDQMGKIGSFTTMGRDWVHTSNTPFRWFKATVGEGGVRSPLIIAGPGIAPGIMRHTPVHVTDITPTIQDLARINPGTDDLYEGKLRPSGISLLPVLRTKELEQDRTFATELFGGRMVRSGKWKAMSANPPIGTGDWELFDIIADPAAATNLANEQPEILARLVAEYDKFAEENGVIYPDPVLHISLSALYDGQCGTWCSTKFFIAETLLDPVKRWIAFILSLLLLGAIFFGFYRRINRGRIT